MIKKIVATTIIVFLLLFTTGCDKIPGQSTTSSAGSTVIKSVELASQWQMNQMQIVVKANDELSILVKLEADDKADGYFYLEKGSNVSFSITGNSLLYKSNPDKPSGKITSDRFTFTASEDEGTTYTLLFRNTADSQITLIMELIYPVTGSMYIPVTSK